MFWEGRGVGSASAEQVSRRVRESAPQTAGPWRASAPPVPGGCAGAELFASSYLPETESSRLRAYFTAGGGSFADCQARKCHWPFSFRHTAR